MHATALLYEVGDDLEEDEIANYNANLEKVLSELPSPVTGGTMLTVEDLQQEFTCNIHIKHREEFDEEKEPDGMVLSGWTQALPEKKDAKTSNGNGTSTSKSLPTKPGTPEIDTEVKEISDGTVSPEQRENYQSFLMAALWITQVMLMKLGITRKSKSMMTKMNLSCLITGIAITSKKQRLP
ncbi:UBIQUITIN-ACTIVATING ENZYME E1 [Salix koriyanagi]|uniref:UBIQUITIN-ACTIVATING ENZYME E1 n=1 Tax=Salix koriyanagi TaxID=2511006 RepID=A0A9Q0UZW8_9ROSI|nr:UBIQUITIN-ACTIVATING ENZYME E1 [Salix koriyanagi]